MKSLFVTVLFFAFVIISPRVLAQSHPTTSKHLFMDVHHAGPGNVTYEAAAGAHAKDLATQGKYNVQFIKYWVDEKKGVIYCLSSSYDTASIRKTHAEAHGLLPDICYPVTAGMEAALKGKKELFLDTHYFGAGKVSAKDVAAAHEKDLAVQHKHGVNFVNYWVDEKNGVVMCLAEAKDSNSVIEAHKEAHGLIPASVVKVKEGK